MIIYFITASADANASENSKQLPFLKLDETRSHPDFKKVIFDRGNFLLCTVPNQYVTQKSNLEDFEKIEPYLTNVLYYYHQKYSDFFSISNSDLPAQEQLCRVMLEILIYRYNNGCEKSFGYLMEYLGKTCNNYVVTRLAALPNHPFYPMPITSNQLPNTFATKEDFYNHIENIYNIHIRPQATPSLWQSLSASIASYWSTQDTTDRNR